MIGRSVQSVYYFTSEQLGVGATGPIRTVVHRFARWGQNHC